MPRGLACSSTACRSIVASETFGNIEARGDERTRVHCRDGHLWRWQIGPDCLLQVVLPGLGGGLGGLRLGVVPALQLGNLILPVIFDQGQCTFRDTDPRRLAAAGE